MTPELSQWLSLMRMCSGDELCDLVLVLGLCECLPTGFLATLNNDEDLMLCYQVAVICYGVTGSIQVPCEMQLKAVLSDFHGKDTLISAGTGSGTMNGDLDENHPNQGWFWTFSLL